MIPLGWIAGCSAITVHAMTVLRDRAAMLLGIGFADSAFPNSLLSSG
jgi:hypothetical protein